MSTVVPNYTAIVARLKRTLCLTDSLCPSAELVFELVVYMSQFVTSSVFWIELHDCLLYKEFPSRNIVRREENDDML